MREFKQLLDEAEAQRKAKLALELLPKARRIIERQRGELADLRKEVSRLELRCDQLKDKLYSIPSWIRRFFGAL